MLYKHFASMEDIIEAVALEGFGELAEALRTARHEAGADEVRAVGNAYNRLATENPAVYDAMFTRSTRLRFAAEDTELREAVTRVAGERDIDTLTEVLWASLHGLNTLRRADRLRPDHDAERFELLLAQFSDAAGPANP